MGNRTEAQELLPTNFKKGGRSVLYYLKEAWKGFKEGYAERVRGRLARKT